MQDKDIRQAAIKSTPLFRDYREVQCWQNCKHEVEIVEGKRLLSHGSVKVEEGK